MNENIIKERKNIKDSNGGILDIGKQRKEERRI